MYIIQCCLCAASQMWTFATLLPLMVGDLIPEDEPKWECFLMLLQITKYCTATVVTESMAITLEALINDHHQLFCLCYGRDKITPKFHYMCHFPKQLLEYVVHYMFMYMYMYKYCKFSLKLRSFKTLKRAFLV